MNLSPILTVRYNDTNFECDAFQVGFRSKYIKAQIARSLIPIIEIKGIWSVENFGIFMNFCQTGNTSFLDQTNALEFRAIASFFESEDLINATQSYFDSISPHQELRELLLCISNNNNPTTYENSVGNHLAKIISDELLLTVPITSLFRIFCCKHEEEPNSEQVGKVILEIIRKYGKCASAFLKFVRIPALPSNMILEYREEFKKYEIGSVEDCDLLLKIREEIEEKKKTIDYLNEQINEKNGIINEKKNEIEAKNQSLTIFQNDINQLKESTKPHRELLSLYIKYVPIIPDVPFSFIFNLDGIDKAMTVTNIPHFGVGFALTFLDFDPENKYQQFFFRQSKKNTIESSGRPGQMLDDNYSADKNEGTILYVHPPNGFTNQQWTYVDNRIVTQRNQFAVTFVKGLNPHPFRLYPIDESKSQMFVIKYP